MEQENRPTLLTLEQAEGTVGVERTPEVVQRAEAIVHGEFHRVTSGNIICKCIDGRNCANGIEGPNSAGGTLSLLVADDLTTGRFMSLQEPTTSGMTRLTEKLQAHGQPVGVHADTNASGESSGCGANDKLPMIYAMMVKKAEVIRQLVKEILGKPIPDSVHDLIMSRATERALFSSGADVRKAVIDSSSEAASETLEGGHKEIVAVINMVAGTTLDRSALEEESGGEYQAFNVDAWSFEASARAISQEDDTDDMIHAKVIALTYYNLATALVLCGPYMLVGVRK